MKLSESVSLLDDASELLDVVKEMYINEIKEEEISFVLRLKIKHFLEDVRSSLDYAAYKVFNEYCSKNIRHKLEDHQKRVYFPIKDTKEKFDKYIRGTFPGLLESKQDIVDTFEKCQTFASNSNWTYHLNELCNKNKHRSLTKQYRSQTTHIRQAQIAGITMENVTMVNVRTPIAINGKPLDIFSDSPHIKSLDASSVVDFIFLDLGISVISTLDEILINAKNIIIRLQENTK